MANTYHCGDYIEEEDRECENANLRAETEYLEVATKINSRILKVMINMNDEEIKTAIMNGGLSVVSRL